jgi:hypothetical protein
MRRAYSGCRSKSSSPASTPDKPFDASTPIPTYSGDVLILVTVQSFKTHVVGQIEKDGQQDFRLPVNVKYEVDLSAAVTAAKILVLPGRLIFCRNIDTGDWWVIPR